MLSKVNMIKENILYDISTGQLQKGELLLSRTQFMRRYGCARGTIDSAIKDLIKGGNLYARQGAGTYVSGVDVSKKIEKVYIVEPGKRQVRGASFVDSSRVAADLQRHVTSQVIYADELTLSLDRVLKPGNAVIWMRPSYRFLMTMDYIAGSGIPQLLIGRTYGNFDYVTTDAGPSIFEGLEWLHSKAGDDIAFITHENDPDRQYIAERQIAFFEACSKLGIKLNSDLIFKSDFKDFKNDLRSIIDELIEKKPVKGIFLNHISASVNLVASLEEKGYEFGKDIFLLNFDDEWRLHDQEGIALLTQRWYKMGDMAVDWVLQSRRKPFKKKIKTKFIKG
jgi:hypothetical protein